MRTFRGRVWLVAALLMASPVMAQPKESPVTVSGTITDVTGAALPKAQIILRDVATGRETTVTSEAAGKYTVNAPGEGTYLVIITRQGFSEAARTLVATKDTSRLPLDVQLELGALTSEVSVTAARNVREIRQIPLHVETISGAAVNQTLPASTGDALSSVANITPVGNGPFGIRPRLRGLDSTRMLVLVDGERLNTARQATDRTGAEVGLISPDAITRMEIVNGAGTLLYGSDALAGTINIVTNELTFTSTRQYQYGLNSFYSSNEDGRRGTLTFGVSAPRYAVRVQGGVEEFGNYRAGLLDVEDTRRFFANGQLRRIDTVDDAF